MTPQAHQKTVQPMPDLHGKPARMDASPLKDLLGHVLGIPACDHLPAPQSKAQPTPAPGVQSRMQPADLVNVLLPSPPGEDQERPLQLDFILCLPAGEGLNA